MTGYNTYRYETSMMHEPRTIAATPPPAGQSILSSPPTYDGIGADEYIEWETKIDNIFTQIYMCERRKIKNATSVLRQSESTWWESLVIMRENFVNPSLVINSNDEVHQLDQSLVIPPVMPNLFTGQCTKERG